MSNEGDAPYSLLIAHCSSLVARCFIRNRPHAHSVITHTMRAIMPRVVRVYWRKGVTRMTVVTRQWLRRGMAVGALLLTAVMLSACIEANSASTINPDLTGTTKVRIGISKVALQTIMQIGSSLGGTPTPGSSDTTDNPFADLNTQASALGGTVTPYDNADFTGVEIAFTFNSLDEMQKQINSVLGDQSGASGSPSSSNPLSGGGGPSALIQITAQDTGSTVRIDGTVDPLSELNDPAVTAGAPPGLDLSAILAGGGKVELSFTMPGSINSADSLATQDGTTVSWSFKVGDPKATIFVESAKS
jgi:hypothetical protein